MIDPVDDLEELLSDAVLSLGPAAIETTKIVGSLHSVVAQGSLQPLNEVAKSDLVVGQVHRKVQQVKTRRAAQPIHQASLDTLLKLLAGKGGLQTAENREGHGLGLLLHLVVEARDSAVRLLSLLPLLQSVPPVHLSVLGGDRSIFH